MTNSSQSTNAYINKEIFLTEQPVVHKSSKVTESELGKWTDIGPNSSVRETVIGDYTYTAGDNQIIYANIGKFCSIASHVRVNPGNHPTWRVTQHHATYRRAMYGFSNSDDAEFFEWRRDHKVTIGHDVWIGHGAIIMPGIHIGTGAVVGASAVVTKDIEPYTIVAGVPAKPIRKRFSDEVIKQLLAIAWWDWSREVMEERINDFNDLDQFLKNHA